MSVDKSQQRPEDNPPNIENATSQYIGEHLEHFDAQILGRRASRLGISLEEARSLESKPLFMGEVEKRAAAEGRTTQSVLDEYAQKLRESRYPTADCLLPDEVVDFVNGDLPAELQQHVNGCAACTTLLAAATPSASEIGRFARAMQAETFAEQPATQAGAWGALSGWGRSGDLREGVFGLLPAQEGRWGSFGLSMAGNFALAVLLLLFTAAAAHKVQMVKYNQALIYPQEVPPPPKVVVPKVKMVAPPQPEVARLTPPKISVPKEQPQPELPKPVELKQPDAPKLPPAPPKAVAPPPQPKVGVFASDKPTETANNQAKPEVKAGGFGDPQGAKPNPNSSQSQIVAMGSFNAAPGANTGAGAARKGAVSGTSFGAGVANGVAGGHDMGKVASAGFANGVVGGSGKPGGTVATGAFNTPAAAPAQVAAKSSEPAFIPPVVISEPHPQYTAEAAQLRIQGEVTLQVRFLASGQVEVLRVVNGLGHGLDEQAKRVAEQIRFKPAMKDGHPVDHTTLIHVTFQMA